MVVRRTRWWSAAAFDRLAEIAAAVSVPVSADLEAGYGPAPENVAATVRRAGELGVVGGNIEDAVDGILFPIDEAAERIAAARAAAPAATFVLNARTDAYFAGGSDDPFRETVERALRYVEAGADCVFVPGVEDAATIRRLVEEIPAPLNIVAGLAATKIDVPTLFSLGVKRVSLGGEPRARGLQRARACRRGTARDGNARIPRRRRGLRRTAASIRCLIVDLGTSLVAV
ncbi:isocitrate lyase/phosphoenolpyruvate mutase family protein [Klugiella sp. YN-L-19]|uniref:Isocitrate lyase/phosphoenolpyruvate mutase family protein n=1 Tax=Ruicaihuangia caeni TaxID=3042517 RepID=A0AAW6T533_9MICO|nr:isocitrate lyase/phosphoenolpyruvate mutase family protein [Klugiella sp. YN-L-19]MDI2097459.1 isocitrate lyase/phosphoenolpyruvate mutase family protein [Klugiella sp. YN-L-19]